MIMEVCYSEGSSPPISMEDNRTNYYYIGLSSFAVKEEGKFVDADKNIELDQNSIVNLTAVENHISSVQNVGIDIATVTQSSTESILVTQSVAEDYFSNLSNFGTNVSGTCTIIAIAILLGYYDCYIYDGYVDDRHMNYLSSPYGTNEDFHQYLCNCVNETNPQNTHIYSACDGVNNYLEDQGIVISFTAPMTFNIDVNRTTIVELINHGHPVVTSMGTSYGAQYNHTVVAYGYRYIATSDDTSSIPTDTLFRVHYGWHNSNYYDVWHSSAWFYANGYLSDCTNTGTHFYQISYTGNTRITNDIVFYEKLRVCSSCGYSDTIWSRNP